MTASGAADSLLGLKLDPDWLVVAKCETPRGRTEAAWSVGYIVQNANGDRAYCKALDWRSVFFEDDPAGAIQKLTNAFVFERDLLEHCRVRRMRRVVHAIGSGTVDVPNSFPPRVNYILFDEADGDSRDVLDESDVADFATGIALARDCAVALGQLHRARVTHQDVKPANLLSWRGPSGWSAKLADLGRAFSEHLESPYAELTSPGSSTWAPPELLYGWPDDQARTRQDRELADLFSLGSLLCFALVRVPYSGLLMRELEAEHRWSSWQGGYESAKSILVDAHEQVMRTFAMSIDQTVSDDATELVADLCHPLMDQRGSRSRRGGGRSSFLLERYITHFDVMARRYPVRTTQRLDTGFATRTVANGSPTPTPGAEK